MDGLRNETTETSIAKYKLSDVEKNLKFFKDKILNKNLIPYISVLFTYKYETDLDVSNFIYALQTEQEKTIVKPFLTAIFKQGKPIQSPISEDYFDDYYDDHFHAKSKGHIKALMKNEELIYDLSQIRDNALGIGTRKLKIRLNKLGRTDSVAFAIRMSMEIEDVNIQAKKAWGKYREKIYDKKEVLIEELIQCFLKTGWCFGIQESDGQKTSHIIYFEIPDCEQISFHFTLSGKLKIPTYNKEWDKKENSTYRKLLDVVKKKYSQIIY